MARRAALLEHFSARLSEPLTTERWCRLRVLGDDFRRVSGSAIFLDEHVQVSTLVSSIVVTSGVKVRVIENHKRLLHEGGSVAFDRPLMLLRGTGVSFDAFGSGKRVAVAVFGLEIAHGRVVPNALTIEPWPGGLAQSAVVRLGRIPYGGRKGRAAERWMWAAR